MASESKGGDVGTPTVFISHAWLFSFLNVMAALRGFVDRLPAGSPPQFFWFDTFCVDEHTSQTAVQQWWSTTFQEAIGHIGHTLMILSPWSHPVPLTRAWCLWELYCTVVGGAKFSVSLGPTESDQFEQAVLGSASVVLDAFGGIDVAKAKASNPSDLTMILEAAATVEGGFAGLNGVAITALRGWVLDRVHALVSSRVARHHSGRPLDSGGQSEALRQAAIAANEGGNVLADLGRADSARLFYQAAAIGFGALGDMDGELVARGNLAATLVSLGQSDEAETEYRSVLAAEVAHRGGRSEESLKTRMNLSTTLSDMGKHEAARVELDEVVAGLSALKGPAHRETLRAKSNLASLLGDLGEHAAAAALFGAVGAARAELLGPGHWQTLFTAVGRASEVLSLGDAKEAARLLAVTAPALAAQLGAEHEKVVWAFEVLAAAQLAI